MRLIDCCVCLEENVSHYNQEKDIIIQKSTCKHPVCKNCYFLLVKVECPLCRISIRNLLLDIKKAIFHILHIRYEKLLGDIKYIDIIFGYNDIFIVEPTFEYCFMYKNAIKDIAKFYYLHNKPYKKNYTRKYRRTRVSFLFKKNLISLLLNFLLSFSI
jgi:hypothetical protein